MNIQGVKSFEEFYNKLVSTYIVSVNNNNNVTTNTVVDGYYIKIYDLACQLILSLHTHFPLSKVKNKI